MPAGGPRRLADTAATARVFFALWPGAALRRELHAEAGQLVRECGGRAVAPGNIHLTLVFAGSIERDRVATLASAAAAVRAHRFEFDVDRVGYWRASRVAWAGPSHAPPGLTGLYAQIGAALRQAGIAFDERPYAPHITLVRNARRAPARRAAPALHWVAADFALIESAPVAGRSAYRVVSSWPLGTGAIGGYNCRIAGEEGDER